MKQRPGTLLALSIGLGAITISFPLQIMILFGHPPTELSAIVAKLGILNWAVMLLAAASAIAVLNASRWCLMATPLFLIALIWNNWVVGAMALNYSLTATTLATVVVFAAHGVLLRPEIRKLIAEPKLRWWLTPVRKQAALNAVIWPTLGGKLISQTYDISEGGAFIVLDPSTGLFSSPLKNLKEGNRLSIRLDVDRHRVIQCSAEVVRHAPARGAYPSGFAVRFHGLSREERRIIAGLVASERKAHEPLRLAA